MGSVEIYSSPKDLAEAAAVRIVQQLNKAVAGGNRITIALSGGETPRLLFSVLHEKYGRAAEWSKADFFWVDERCVPPDDPDSNFGSANSIFFSRVEIPGSSVHRVIGEADPENEAERYSEILRKYVPQVDNFPSFDIIILGLGNDGHTASIFPGRNDLFGTDDICSVAEHPEKSQKRITITGKTINNGKEIIFLVSGKGKAEIVNRIITGKDAEKYPAALVKPVHGKLVWMMDSDASSLIRIFHPQS